MNWKDTVMRSLMRFTRERSNRKEPLSPADGWTVDGVCALLGVPPPADTAGESCFSTVCSNDVPTKGCLFILCREQSPAKAGEAIRSGAAAVLTDRPIDCPHRILVEDVIEAQIILFRKLYEKLGVPATVITGSVGKTTATQMVELVYSTQYRTFCDGVTENVFQNLPAQFRRFDRQAEKYVVEASEQPMFCTRHFSRILHPEIALITTIDKSHISRFGSEENICASICSVADGMDADGCVIVNADDPRSKAASFRQRRISVAILDKTADCIAENITETADLLEFDCIFRGERTRIRLHTPGRHNAYNAMMAFVAGRLNDIPGDRIASGLARYRPKGYRQKLYHAAGRTIYADCYNASGRSVCSALNVMKTVQVKGKKAAILGDIAEIDGFEEGIYQSIADELDRSDIDVLVTFGKVSRCIGERVTRPLRHIHCDTRAELNGSVRALKKEGVQAFLFKGSRVMRMEKAIRAAFPLLYQRIVLPEKVRYCVGILRGAIPDDF